MSRAEPKTVAQVLREAADLIEPKGAWCKQWYARTKDGESVPPDSPAACRWCAEGALMRVTPHRLEFDVFKAIEKALGHTNVAAWNDGTTQARVVAKLREAAALAEEEAAHV